jgi:hypothetical protein
MNRSTSVLRHIHVGKRLKAGCAGAIAGRGRT